MTRKQIKSEFPNEVDTLRTTLSELKVKLPGLDAFLLANPECVKCSNSKDYQCVQLKGKPGCRTCTTRRISCSRHIQYLVETAASRLEWSVEKTKSMYDKYVKQTRNGRKSPSKVKRVTVRKTVDAPQKLASESAADEALGEGRKEGQGVAAAEEGEHEGGGGSEFQDGAQQVLEDLEDFSDEPEEDEEDDGQDLDWDEGTANSISHSIPKIILRATLSNARTVPKDSQEEMPISGQQVTIPVLGPDQPAGSDPGLRVSLRHLEKTVMPERVDDLNLLTQPMDETSSVSEVVPIAVSEHVPAESSMSAEQRIKQLEKKVARLNVLRLADAASISRLTKKADTAFDNMSVLLSRIRIHRQELDANVTKHIEPANQKHFKSVITKMDETSVSGTQMLMLLDKRKDYVIPTTRVPVVIIDEEGQEWVPQDVVSELQDTEKAKKHRMDDGDDSLAGEVSSKRRKS